MAAVTTAPVTVSSRHTRSVGAHPSKDLCGQALPAVPDLAGFAVPSPGEGVAPPGEHWSGGATSISAEPATRRGGVATSVLVAPMLATLGRPLPAGAGYSVEMKWDGSARFANSCMSRRGRCTLFAPRRGVRPPCEAQVVGMVRDARGDRSGVPTWVEPILAVVCHEHGTT
jgi:hypothetical protein